MSEHVEPPVLLARLLTFVCAALVVVLATLGYTLYKMFPLTRPEVFFISTQNRGNLEVKLGELLPVDENLSIYKQAFIFEYVKARNEITPSIATMRRKWQNSANGTIRAWSTDDVFGQFAQTAMWNAIMNDIPDFDFNCTVEFHTGAIEKYNDNRFAVTFRYFCSNNNGQTQPKDYKIIIGLESDTDTGHTMADRINNPLGIRVSQYVVDGGNGDPLDTGFRDDI